MKPETRLYIGLFGVQTAMMIGVMIIPFFVKDMLGGTERTSALAYGTQMVGLGAVCLLSAPFLKRAKNSGFWAFVGFVVFGVPYTLCVFCRTPLLYYVMGAISMGGLAIAWPAMLAWLGGQPDEKLRARSLSYFNTIVGVGLVVGGLLAGWLYDRDYRLAFLGVGILSAVGIAAIYGLPREEDYFGTRAKAEQASQADIKLSRANEAHMYCLWLAAVVAWGLVGVTRTAYATQIENLFKAGSMVVLSTSLPLHVFTSHGSIGAATLYSWTQTALSVAFVVTPLAMGRTTFWERKFWLLALIGIATAGAIFLLADSRSLLLILFCHLVFGGNAAFCNLASQFYSVANQRLKQQRSAINQGLISISGLFIPLWVAQAAVKYGSAVPFRYMPAAVIVTIGVEGLLLLYGISKFVRHAEPVSEHASI